MPVWRQGSQRDGSRPDPPSLWSLWAVVIASTRPAQRPRLLAEEGPMPPIFLHLHGHNREVFLVQLILLIQTTRPLAGPLQQAPASLPQGPTPARWKCWGIHPEEPLINDRPALVGKSLSFSLHTMSQRSPEDFESKVPHYDHLLLFSCSVMSNSVWPHGW